MPDQPPIAGPPEDLLKFCEEPRGQFASASCDSFINCWDDVAVEQYCPSGLKFSTDINACDYPQNVDCGERSATHAPEASPDVNSGCSEGSYGTHRNPANCSEFVVCVAGIPHQFSCPESLNYNDRLGVCDYPYRVDCTGSVNTQPSPAAGPPPPSSEFIDPYVETPDQRSSHRLSLRQVPPAMISPDLPAPCTPGVMHNLDPSCSSVAICADDGKTKLLMCPYGYAFDVTAGSCLQKSVAKCWQR